MPFSLLAPVGDWTDPVVVKKNGNQLGDVGAVQALLKAASQKSGKKEFDPKSLSGLIAKPPRKSDTLEALERFQRQFMAKPDRRVDPGGQTWNKLQNYEGIPNNKLVLGPPQLVSYNGKLVPFFAQGGDSTWADETLGNNKTIRKAGCAITSIAMILKYYGRNIDPKSLDSYLDSNNGYVGDNVVWSVALKAGATQGTPKLTITETHFNTASKFNDVLADRIGRNWPTLAHIDYGNDTDTKGDHWVVIVGKAASGHFIINDPGTKDGNGAANPGKAITMLGRSTRKGGLKLVRLCLFKVQ